MENVLKKNGNERYKYFLNYVCDVEEAWGLYNDGWALAADAAEAVLFPLWPAKEYAAFCCTGEWENYRPQKIDLDDIQENLFPKLKKDGLGLGIFYTPSDKGVPVSVERLENDFSSELENYK